MSSTSHERSWDTPDGYYVQVTPYEVVVGNNPGPSGHTDNAATVTHKAFLKGAFQDHVREHFSEEVLAEVVRSVRAAKRNVFKPNKETKKVRQEDKTHLNAWRTIPVDEHVGAWGVGAEEDGYRDNYGYGPDGTTLVQLGGGVTFQSGLGEDRHDARFTFADGSTKEIRVMPMPAIGYGGYLYMASNGLSIWNEKGEQVFDTGDVAEDGNYNETHGIGSSYRLGNVLRFGDHILVEYRNHFLDRKDVLKELGAKGWLLVDPAQGFIARSKELKVAQRWRFKKR